ncbi:MAG: class I SAM-dependent methyltransferase [Desulfobaccales bacterium]
MTHTYSLDGYGQMILDAKRTAGYREALRSAVSPGAVVLDIGTGIGMFALLACQCGAARVYAIDPSDLLDLARDLAAANGYAERIHFIQDVSTRITLPEPVDVIVSDLHGSLPFFQQIIPTIVDARQRFLAPGGRLIPQEDTLWAAVVALPEVYEKHTSAWKEDVYGLDLRAAWPLAINQSYSARVTPEDMLAPAQCWWTLNFYTVAEPDARCELAWTTDRAGTAHGIVLWFDALLAPGVSFSNRPGESPGVYAKYFFPWPEPMNLEAGDVVSVDLAANLVGDDYLWRWDTRILDESQPGRLKAEFRQSTFLGAPVSPASLKQRASTHVPVLTEDGRIDRFILELMDGQSSLGEISRRLSVEFPARFAGENEAMARVGDLSLNYGRPPDNKYLRNT